MLEIGKNIVKGIWNGITSAGSWLWGKITGWCNDFVAGFKKGLGIHSPSKLFADIIGKNIALGIGQGFSDNISSVVQSMTAPSHFCRTAVRRYGRQWQRHTVDIQRQFRSVEIVPKLVTVRLQLQGFSIRQ